MNNTLFLENLATEIKARGLKTNGLLFIDYRNTLTVEQEKQYNEAKEAAKKKTLKLQDMFPTMLGIDRRRLHTEWLANIIQKNERIGMRIRT